MNQSLLDKIEKASLKGRGGAAFPVAIKWRAIINRLKKNPKSKYYLVINAAEGEPGVRKDAYILENELETFLTGVKDTASFIGLKRLAGIYCFINQEYHQAYSKKINALLKDHRFLMISVFWRWSIKPKELSYISGEETCILNIIESGSVEPRLKPPLPVESGLFSEATLVNNVETFHQIALVSQGRFDNRRFYTINGEVPRPGVYYLPEKWSVADVLHLTGNWPSFKFFVQVGGDAAGEVLGPSKFKKTASGSASITVYSWFGHDSKEMIGRWLRFFKDGSCGKCTPCREGTAHLLKLYEENKAYSPEFWDILDLLNQGSFCAYGRSISLPLSSYYENIIKNKLADG